MHDRDDVKQKNHSTGQSIHGDEKLQKKKNNKFPSSKHQTTFKLKDIKEIFMRVQHIKR